MLRLGSFAPWSGAVVLCLLLGSERLIAACDTPVGNFVSITGAVDVQASGGGSWAEARLDTRLCQGDSIRVGERSRAAVALINDAVLRIDQSTTMRLIDIVPEEQESSLLDLLKGAFQSFSRKPKFLKVNTPYLNGSVEGTEFLVRVDDGAATFIVLEGVVVAANPQGRISIRPGESVQAAKGEAPQRRTMVKPRDAVQWALYYPPVLTVAELEGTPGLRAALACAADGDTACVFAALDSIPAAQRDAPFSLLRADTLLSVGRIEEAGAAIESALRQDPRSGSAYALRAVMGVAQNRRESALADARRAVELSPDSAAARIALSYALQADLQLREARETLLAAVERRPEAALAWARLAELHLSLGDRSAAHAAARRAVQLRPGLSRTHNVLGFAALAEIRIDQAAEAFRRAIELDSADPLPRLGLGLAKIRMGHLDAGRRDIEAAVALDSNNALLRAYLGKAYFEEKRAPLDARQLGIAKGLDPLDPTAYLYDAIRLQTENQPVQALNELEASIDRNDNRAVYRSRLQLDQDRAARGTSQARVYNELGFPRSALEVATRSLSLDPANAAAHRFLSDSYAGVRRREISRVSELLQAQMLQDININPIQPSTSEANLNTVSGGGPASVGFNEFTPLFEREGGRFDLSVAAGNNDTQSGEAVISGIYDRVSLSAGGYTYRSDGWRPNNQLEQDIVNLYAQAAITPELNVQAELRRRESTEGDIAFNFDPDNFSENQTVERDLDTARLGLRYTPSPASNLLLSYIFSERKEVERDSAMIELFPGFSVPFFEFEGTGKVKSHQTEAQYIYQQERYNLVAGLAYGEIDSRETTAGFIGFGPPTDLSGSSEGKITHPRGYLYANLHLSDALVATLGASYDDYEEDLGFTVLKETRFNPKLGAQWQVNEALRLRAAAFKVLKPALVTNRTLEPTQVAGFNQFFDDVNTTRSTRYGAGFDWALSRQLTFGGEATWRDLDEPVLAAGSAFEFQERDEQLHRLYLYWTPSQRVSASAGLVYDRYGSEFTDSELPEKVETLMVPLGVRYFLPSGLYAGIAGTHVDQEVERAPAFSDMAGQDSFFLVDLTLGYRLPKRSGRLSLEVKNLFDEEFRYQDDSYRGNPDEPSTGPFFPERTLLGQVVLSF